ncbi:MAG: methyl-accepting chemotaxis protein, partial [Candidatus Competibacterales bacterium]
MSEARGEAGVSAGTFSSKYFVLLTLLVISIVLMVLTLVSVARQDSVDTRNLSLMAEQRLLSRDMVIEALAAARGDGAAFEALRNSKNRFNEILELEKLGDAEAGFSALPSGVSSQIDVLEEQWRQMRLNIDTVLAGRDTIQLIDTFRRDKLDRVFDDLVNSSEVVARALINANASDQQIFEATLQLARLESVAQSLGQMLAVTANVERATRDFGTDIRQFATAVRDLIESAPQSGIERVNSLLNTLRADAARIINAAPEILQVQEAVRAIAAQGDELLSEVTALQTAYTSSKVGRVELFGLSFNADLASYAFGATALLLLAALALFQRRDTRFRLSENELRRQATEEQNRRNQEAILRLLDELGDLAEGDLTVQASVTEDITGAIADSVNYAIEALRDLVSTINRTAEQMASAAQDTRAVADRLARASEVQARQIESSSKTVMQMAQFMDDVSEKTAASAEVAEKSVGIAHEGGDRVRSTIQGMDAIREHIQETSKRIKRLGESSQEIGDIVALINDIADQTNILALNAAIQASAAGEAGRGFAVVADEVQRLAERSSNATKRIEALVKTIQADTNEAVIAMEKSTTEVVKGAGLAEKAGEALEEIEKVSANLAELINEISTASGQVTEMAARVSSAMASINEITAQTSESSVATANSINKLNQLAQELQQSVAGFRLPEQT